MLKNRIHSNFMKVFPHRIVIFSQRSIYVMESCVVFCLYLVFCHLRVDYFWLSYKPSGLINTQSFRRIAHLAVQRHSLIKRRNIIEKLLSIIFKLIKFHFFYVPVLVFFYKFIVEDGWVYFCLSKVVRVEG